MPRYTHFYRASISEGCLGSRNYVSPSVTHVHCDKTKWCTAGILLPHERAFTLLLWYQQRLVGDAPSLWNLRSKWPTPFEKCWHRQISAYNVSTVRDSKKKFNYDDYKVDHRLYKEL